MKTWAHKPGRNQFGLLLPFVARFDFWYLQKIKTSNAISKWKQPPNEQQQRATKGKCLFCFFETELTPSEKQKRATKRIENAEIRSCRNEIQMETQKIDKKIQDEQ